MDTQNKKSSLWDNIIESGDIDSVGKLLEVIKGNRKQKEVQRFFRGESKNYGNTILMPTVFRPGKKDESTYYYDILTNLPNEFENLSSISRLAKMQHYRVPTRLLDLTFNPLVALYMACRSMESKDKDKKEIGRFYIIEMPSSLVLNFDSDKALLLSCLSRLNKTQQDSVYEFVCEFVNGGNGYYGQIDDEYVKYKRRPDIKPINSKRIKTETVVFNSSGL